MFIPFSMLNSDLIDKGGDPQRTSIEPLKSVENRSERLPFVAGNQVQVAPSYFGGMSQPTVDETLIHSFGGAITGEAVSQDVPAPNHFPLASGQGSFEVIVGFVLCDRSGFAS